MHNDTSWPLAPWRRQVLRTTTILFVALSGFQLGRLSEGFRGSALQWTVLVLSILVILVAIYEQSKRVWRSSNPVGDR